jgi:hypothetical protein
LGRDLGCGGRACARDTIGRALPHKLEALSRAGRTSPIWSHQERRYVCDAVITLNEKLRERLWARVNAKAKPMKGVTPGTRWLKPDLVGRCAA